MTFITNDDETILERAKAHLLDIDPRAYARGPATPPREGTHTMPNPLHERYHRVLENWQTDITEEIAKFEANGHIPNRLKGMLFALQGAQHIFSNLSVAEDGNSIVY